MSRILVVDDEDEVRSALLRRLERAGHTVHAADSVKEGMAALGDDCPTFDVVITDMSMEEGDSGVRMLKAALDRSDCPDGLWQCEKRRRMYAARRVRLYGKEYS